MKVIIVGCGYLGAWLAIHLQTKGYEITLIDKKSEAFKKLPNAFHGATIVGHGIDKEVLESVNIHMVDAVITCTNSDETNALLARVAKNEYMVPRVIARIYDPRKADIYQSFGIQTISPIIWGVHKVSELLSYNQLDSVWSYENGDVEMIRIETPPLLIGHPLSELRRIGEVEIVTIVRDNQAFIPVTGTVLEGQDILYLIVARSSIDKIKIMLGLE